VNLTDQEGQILGKLGNYDGFTFEGILDGFDS